MHAEQPSQRGDMRDLNRPFVNFSWDVCEHNSCAGHKFVIVHIKSNEAMDIRHLEFLVDTELIKELENLMNRCSQHCWFCEEIRFQGVGVFVWPKCQRIINLSQGFDNFDESLVVSIKFKHSSDFLIHRDCRGHHLECEVKFVFPRCRGPVMVQRGHWG